MAWAQNTTTGEWEHSGTTRDAYRWPDPQEAKAWIPYRFAKISDKPVIMIHLSEDARTGFEIGIMSDAGASTANLTIRFRDDNVPGAPLYQAAHNIPADTPFDLEVAIDGNGFYATISTTDVTAVRLPTEGNASSGDYSTYRGHAFVSDVDGARIISGGTQPAESVVAVTNSPLVGFAKGNGLPEGEGGFDLAPWDIEIVSEDAEQGTVYVAAPAGAEAGGKVDAEMPVGVSAVGTVEANPTGGDIGALGVKVNTQGIESYDAGVVCIHRFWPRI